MNKKISTSSGLITGMLILAYILFLMKFGVAANSPYSFVPFIMLFVGIFISCMILYKYYADIKPIEAFTHCLKTLATTLFILILGNSLLFFVFAPATDRWSQLTILIMKIIFAYSLSGFLSALFSSFIFNTFTKK